MNHEVTSLWSLSFFDLWHPITIIVLIAIGWCYIWAVRKREPNFSKAKMIFFLSGLLLYYVSEGSPLKAIGHHYLFSVHMLSMSISFFAVPPLILGGLYEWMIEPLFKIKGLKRFIHFITNPLLAVILFNLLISFYHIPVIFNWIMEGAPRMIISHFILLFFAFVMWVIITVPSPKLRTLTNLQKLGYVFAASILLTPACAMIMFSDSFLYVKTANSIQVLNFLPPLQDQKTGGVIMKIIQEIVFVGTIAYIFYQWAKTERDPDGNDLNPKVDLLKNH